MLITAMILAFILVSIILTLFMLVSKSSSWEKDASVAFECGFTSSFISRFSFSMHFYTVGLIFLFLDLELCFVMPFFNENLSSAKMLSMASTFILIMLVGVLVEWGTGELDWKF